MNNLNAFAIKHKVTLEAKGEIGFGRPCVGFIKGNSYIDYDPIFYTNYESVFPDDDFNYKPDFVEDAYHKHDCMAVLVHDDDYDTALEQLAAWVDYLEENNVQIVKYDSKANGIQAMFGGRYKYALRKPE